MDKEGIEDQTSEEKDEEIVDDLGDEDDAFLDQEVDEEESGDESEEGKKPDESVDERIAKAERKARSVERKYDKAVKRIQTLEDRKKDTGDLSEQDQKTLDAEKWFREQYEKAQATKQEQEDIETQEMSDELDEVLDDNPTLKESQLLEVIEEFAKDGIKLSPRQAFKVLQRTPKAEPKPKPKMPRSKRGEGKVDLKPLDTDNEEYQKKSFSEKIAIRRKRIQAKWGKQLEG